LAAILKNHKNFNYSPELRYLPKEYIVSESGSKLMSNCTILEPSRHIGIRRHIEKRLNSLYLAKILFKMEQTKNNLKKRVTGERKKKMVPKTRK